MAAPPGFFPPPPSLCLPCLAAPDPAPKPAPQSRSESTTCECWSWVRLRKSAGDPCSGPGRLRRGSNAGQQAKREGRCITRSLLGEARGAVNRSLRNGFLTQERRLPCGLLPSQVSDLLDREITPDDYEMLLLLDECIAKPTASRTAVESLPAVSAKEFLGETCTVCLHAFEHREGVVSLKCKHFFHHECISKWLLEHGRLCPLCGDEQPRDPH
mmetsp:Transcript_68019/g.178356  ORF Transcript_68019/g.178356 Transcript_68019/m.178356 type:complete len:214 (-) Transcript_68019:7-648(-)